MKIVSNNKTGQPMCNHENIFINIKLKAILIFFCFLVTGIAVCTGLYQIKIVSTPRHEFTVVIDAGHGGQDGGSIGANGTIEKTINLDYAMCLKDMMEQFGFKVILTRKNDDGLYNENAKNKKRDDMEKRKQIIENANADFVVSIHMNSFPNKSARGAEVYYCQGSESGKILAQAVQNKFLKNLPNAKSLAKPEEFYMLQQVTCPSILVECGFISNVEEEKLLNTDEYKKEICYSIILGVLEYLQ